VWHVARLETTKIEIYALQARVNLAKPRIRNALLVGERRGRLDGSPNAILDDLGTLPIELRQPPIGTAIFELGRKHDLSLYDAASICVLQSESHNCLRLYSNSVL